MAVLQPFGGTQQQGALPPVFPGNPHAAGQADPPVSALDNWLEPSLPDMDVPWRCRLGLHRWLPLALSLHGAGAGLSLAFCRCCPAVRRPASLGSPRDRTVTRG